MECAALATDEARAGDGLEHGSVFAPFLCYDVGAAVRPFDFVGQDALAPQAHASEPCGRCNGTAGADEACDGFAGMDKRQNADFEGSAAAFIGGGLDVENQDTATVANGIQLSFEGQTILVDPIGKEIRAAVLNTKLIADFGAGDAIRVSGMIDTFQDEGFR